MTYKETKRLTGLGNERSGVKLFLGRIPGRKQACFYFEEGNRDIPVVYVSEANLPEAERLWLKFQEGFPERTA